MNILEKMHSRTASFRDNGTSEAKALPITIKAHELQKLLITITALQHLMYAVYELGDWPSDRVAWGLLHAEEALSALEES